MKPKYLIPTIMLVILIFTNPKLIAFKEYLGRESYRGLKRNKNFFICSKYVTGRREFLGILGNFFELNLKENNNSNNNDGIDTNAVVTEVDSLTALPPLPKGYSFAKFKRGKLRP